MKKLLLVLLLATAGTAMACASWRTETGVELRSGAYSVMPYIDVKCNIPLEFLSLEAEDMTIIGTWLVPEVYLTPKVEWMWTRVELLMDMPWPGQFGASAKVGVSEPFRAAFFYRHSW